jgi:cation diffusion facilitator family transporter
MIRRNGLPGGERLIDLLTHMFVADSDDTQNPKVRHSYGMFTGTVGIIVNILLFFGKLIIGTLASSVSIRADAINNLSDAGSSLISLVSFKISSKPADREHPFGHSRIEYIASIIVSFFIMHVAVGLLTESFDRILHPKETIFGIATVVILSISIAAKGWLYILNRNIGRKINSSVMGATAADSLSDVMATSAVLLSAVISRITGFDTDGYMGMAVAVLIFISGLKILVDASNNLLGAPPDPDMLGHITEYVKKYDEVLDIHDIVIHNYGPGRCFASFHAEVDGKQDVYETHDAIDNIERELSEMYGIHCAVHLDPIVTDDPFAEELRERVDAIVNMYDGVTMHDFRMVTGPTHSNLIFDLVIPYEYKIPASQIKDEIDGKIKKIDKNYYTVITIDQV